MRIKIRQLQAFREVVRNGSITSAAHALSLSQPTVSNLIIGLENELGVTLFQRIHKRLVPTQDARKFFAEVDRTFNSIEQLSSTANRLHTKSSAWLNVVLPQSFVVNIVPQALARLRKSHPGIGVTLEFLPTRDAIDYAASGEWDLTIARLPATHRGLDVKPLMTSEYVCVLPKGHRLVALDSLDPADLRDEAVILLLTGDLGNSMREGRPALVTVLARLPLTLQLAIPVFFLKVVIGVTIGIFAALHRNSFIDRGLMMLSVLGITVPTFVIGLVLAVIFAVQLRWLPSGGYTELRHMILPAATMTIAGSTVIARYTRSAMLDVMGQPFVRAASAKGLRSNLVILRHVLPNAAISIITIFGLMLGGLIGGAVVVESVFSWPGVGRLLVDSVSSRDLAVVQTILLMIGLTMVISNLLVDLLYGLIDPRMRNPHHTEP